MKSIREQTEVLQLSIFSSIICQLLKNHNQLSVCKLVTFTYIVKQNKFLGGNIYTAKNTQDVIYKGISLLSGDFDRYCNSLIYIFKAIHLLVTQNVITLENDMITLSDTNIQSDTTFVESNFLNKVIRESKTMTDKQFMKEVTYNV